MLKGQLCSVNPQSVSPGATSSCALLVISHASSRSRTLDAGSNPRGYIHSSAPVRARSWRLFAVPHRRLTPLTHQNYSLGRLDYWTVSARDSLFGRYCYGLDEPNQPICRLGAAPLWPDIEITRNMFSPAEEHHIFRAKRCQSFAHELCARPFTGSNCPVLSPRSIYTQVPRRQKHHGFSWWWTHPSRS